MSKKYIEREALNTELVNKFKSRIGSAYVPSWNDAMDVVNSAPAADVVEVVRCRECRFLERGSVFDLSGEEDKNASFCSVVGFSPDDDWFCSDGKPRDGGQDE